MTGAIKIVLSMLIWSTLGIAVRWLVLPPHIIIFYTALVAGVVQFFILYAGVGIHEVKIVRKERSIIGLAFLIIANAFLYYFALTKTTIANAVLTHYTAPIFVALLSPLILRERVDRITWLSLAMSSAGLWMIFSNNNIVLGGDHIIGVSAGTLSGVAYALLVIVAKPLSQRYFPIAISFLTNSITVILLLPFAVLSKYTIELNAVILLLLMGVIHSTLAVILYLQGLRVVEAHKAAILGYIEPVSAVALAVLFLSEAITASVVIGGILIIVSGYIVLRK